MTGLNGSLFTRADLQLRIWFSDGNSGFAALDPAQRLTFAPYAATALTATSVAGGLEVQNTTNGTPNLVGGSSVNFVAAGVYGATIAGGGASNYFGLSSASNQVTANFGTVGGGVGNIAAGEYSTVSGGFASMASGTFATVSGGSGNIANGYQSVVAGGSGNAASAWGSTVSGGSGNTNNGFDATIGGGAKNLLANSGSATISGGLENTIGSSADYSTIPGGYRNRIGDGAIYSFAAGQNAQALHSGAFVWSDFAGGVPFPSTANNQFSVRAVGGVRFVGNVQIGDGSGDYRYLQLGGGNSSGFLYGSYPNPNLGDGIQLGYNWYSDAGGGGHVFNNGGATSRVSVRYGEILLAVGGINAAPNTLRLAATATGVAVYGTFNNNSDRNAKQDFAPVNSARILDKVAKLPLSEWSYKEDPATRHIGPMAQDFHSAFGVGTDERHIAPIDEGGVALAAIQALNRKLEDQAREKNARINALEQELAELKAAVRNLTGIGGWAGIAP